MGERRATSRAHNWFPKRLISGKKFMVTDSEGWGDILATTALVRELLWQGAEVFLCTRTWDEPSVWRSFEGLAGIAAEHKIAEGIGWVEDEAAIAWYDEADYHIHFWDSGSKPPSGSTVELCDYTIYTVRYVVAGLPVPNRPIRPMIFIDDYAREQADAWLRDEGLLGEPYILLHATSAHPPRKWAYPETRSFCDQAKTAGLPIVNVVSRRYHEAPIPMPGVHNVPGDMELLTVFALLDSAAVAVCTDSSMSHASLGTMTPAVVIYSAGVPGRIRLAGHHPEIVALQSAGYGTEGETEGDREWRGIEDITADMAMGAVRELI